MIFSKLATIMEEKGIKPYPLSRESKLSRTFIDSLMSNDFERLSSKSLNTLCHYLGITSLNDLLIFEPVEIYINNKEEGHIELEKIVYNLRSKGNIDFDFSLYINDLNVEKPKIELLIEIEKIKYYVDVTYKLIQEEDKFHDSVLLGFEVIFDDLSFSENIPVNSLKHLKGWIFHFFSSYIGKTFDTYPIFARYPKELENEDKYRVQDNVSISEELKKISEKQDTYFELLTRYLESQK